MQRSHGAALHALKSAFPGHNFRERKTADGWLVSAPHRDDKNPSFSVFWSNRFQTWLVKDHGDGLSMSLARYLKEYAGVTQEKPYTPRFDKPKEASKPKVDPYKETERVLAEIQWRPYIGHGFDDAIFESDDYEPRDMLELTEPHTWKEKGMVFPSGTVFFVFRDRDGKPYGIQARIPGEGKKGRRFIWRVSPPATIGYNIKDKRALAVAEGHAKAQMGMFMMNIYARGYGKRDPGRFGFIAVAGKSSLPKIEQELIDFKNMLAYFLDPDMVIPFRTGRVWNGKKQVAEKSREGTTLRNVWAQRVMRNRRTVFYEPERDMDLNDMAIKYNPIQAWNHLKRIEKPMWTKDQAAEHMLPLTGDLPASAGALLNAMWVYALMHGKLRWYNGRGYVFEIDPTNIELMELSGLSIKTILKHKRTLQDHEVIRITPTHIRLDLRNLQRFLTPPPDSSTPDEVLSYDIHKKTPPKLAKLAVQNSNRRVGYTYGNTSPLHIQAYTLHQSGANISAIARALNVSRSLVYTALESIRAVLNNLTAAYKEHKHRVRAVRDWAKQRAELARQAYERYLAGERGWWVETWATVWLKMQERLDRRRLWGLS